MVGSEPQSFALSPGSFPLAKSSSPCSRAQPASSSSRAGVLGSLKRLRTHLALRTHCRPAPPAAPHLQRRTQGRARQRQLPVPSPGRGRRPSLTARFPLGALGWRWGPGSIQLVVGASTLLFPRPPQPQVSRPSQWPRTPHPVTAAGRSQDPAASSAPHSPAWASRRACNGWDSLARRAWKVLRPLPGPCLGSRH